MVKRGKGMIIISCENKKVRDVRWRWGRRKQEEEFRKCLVAQSTVHTLLDDS